MRVSIVIPLYNKEQYVERAVRSVLAQTHRDFELIIVDDGSTDRSLEIAQGIQDDRIRIIRQPNKGVGAARNRGVHEASSEWVAFLDADDTWEPEFLRLLTGLSLEGSPVALVANRSNSLEESPTFPFKGKEPFDILDFCAFRLEHRRDPVHASACVVNRGILRSIGGFPEGRVYGEDNDTWVRLSLHGAFRCTRRVLATYNQRLPDAATNKPIPCGLGYPPEASTYRRLRAKLAAERRRTFLAYVRLRLGKYLDSALSDGRLGSGLWLLVHNADIADFRLWRRFARAFWASARRL